MRTGCQFLVKFVWHHLWMAPKGQRLDFRTLTIKRIYKSSNEALNLYTPWRWKDEVWGNFTKKLNEGEITEYWFLPNSVNRFWFISDAAAYTYHSCDSLRSSGIFINGEYLLGGSATPTHCKLWGNPLMNKTFILISYIINLLGLRSRQNTVFQVMKLYWTTIFASKANE